MLSDERLVEVFEDHFLANYEPTDLADIVAGLRAVEAAVRADMQREVRTVEWEYGWLADESIRQTLIPRGPKIMFEDQPYTPEAIARFPKGQRVRRTKAGPWLPVTPSTPNQQGAEK